MRVEGPAFVETDRLGSRARFASDDGAFSDWKPREAWALVARLLLALWRS